MNDFFDESIAQKLNGSHDLRLSQWGPYTKRYMGISHIPDVEHGLRFDVSVFPGLYRRKYLLPDVSHDCGYHPWKATSDLSYFVHRHDMIWKDRLYADVAFLRADSNQVFIHTSFVNNTDLPQNVSLNYLSSIHFPPAKTYAQDPLEITEVDLPDNGHWLDAMDYDTLAPRPDDPKDNLVWDGHLRGEAFRQRQGLVGGSGLLLGPCKDDTVTYSLKGVESSPPSTVVMRYRTLGRGAQLTLNDTPLKLEPTDGFSTVSLPLEGHANDGLKIVCKGGRLVIDGFAFVSPGEESQVTFRSIPQKTAADTAINGNTMQLCYESIEDVYGLAWDDHPCEISRHCGDSVNERFNKAKGSNLWDDDDAQENGRWTNVSVKPFFIEPQSTVTCYGMVVNGSRTSVQERLGDWDTIMPSLPERFATADENASVLSCNPSGETYRFSQERMAATMLTNVVYPIRTRGTYIRHYTPGRMWDCLYTWDSGFVGLGLAELDPERSLDNLNAYVTEPESVDAEGAAFLHHGTPLPVQFYQFLELWNRTQNDALARYFYPRLRRFHRFLAGHDENSSTRNLKSNLLRTWDYFYNSGGWDDYPPQGHTHGNGLIDRVTPAVNTAHAIRTAKILKMIATALGEPTDEYDADITMFGDALQNHSWDESAGYFSYVVHDDKGNPRGPMRHESGQNFNMGLDGTSPLVSGTCTPEQEVALIERLMDPGRIWSQCGLSTVDQSAAYYSDHGYWNGSVWMPHQWFMWKALLSLGYGEQAWRIAHTGLETWKREVEDTYNCYEVFNVKSGRGVGWHHFGGLSSPVLCWFNAYHSPKRLTVGLDTHVASLRIDDTQTCLEAQLNQLGNARHNPVVIAVLKPDCSWSVSFNGTPCAFTERVPGTLEISLPAGDVDGRLIVQSSE